MKKLSGGPLRNRRSGAEGTGGAGRAVCRLLAVTLAALFCLEEILLLSQICGLSLRLKKSRPSPAPCSQGYKHQQGPGSLEHTHVIIE